MEISGITAFLTSDSAILAYEVATIGVLLVLNVHFSKRKKQMRQKQDKDKLYTRDMKLDNALKNERRR